jgi:hypothetical protein
MTEAAVFELSEPAPQRGKAPTRQGPSPGEAALDQVSRPGEAPLSMVYVIKPGGELRNGSAW